MDPVFVSSLSELKVNASYYRFHNINTGTIGEDVLKDAKIQIKKS